MPSNARLFALKEQRQRSHLLVMNNIRMSSGWFRVPLLLSDISCSMTWKTKSLASGTFIHDRHVLKLKRSVLSIKDKTEDEDDIVFQMICKIVV